MKKSLIILSGLLVVLTVAISGFSKEPKSRKIAQAEVTEQILGPVMAMERTFELNYGMCKQAMTTEKNGEISCNVIPKIANSNSLEEAAFFPLELVEGEYLGVRLYVYPYGYSFKTLGLDRLSTGKFLDAVQVLIRKHQTVTIKFLKIFHNH
ncbi:MAG: hypothetical protein HY390_03215 [Deltaproteobacteria bacterium]|nr:hypothetical protein [Deltaproteobacteria bacterium]